jgi:hypothetical protein
MSETKAAIVRYIAEKNDAVYLRDEFSELGTVRQVTRALANLVEAKALVRVGVGLYTPARLSRIDGSAVPIKNMMKIGIQALQKLGIEVDIGSRYKDLYSGRSTQVPMIQILNVGASKTQKKIGYGPTKIHYERNPEKMGP